MEQTMEAQWREDQAFMAQIVHGLRSRGMDRMDAEDIALDRLEALRAARGFR